MLAGHSLIIYGPENLNCYRFIVIVDRSRLRTPIGDEFLNSLGGRRRPAWSMWFSASQIACTILYATEKAYFDTGLIATLSSRMDYYTSSFPLFAILSSICRQCELAASLGKGRLGWRNEVFYRSLTDRPFDPFRYFMPLN